MSKVNINGLGHQVEIDHDGNDLSYVIEKAQKLWEDTRPPKRETAGFKVNGYELDRDVIAEHAARNHA